MSIDYLLAKLNTISKTCYFRTPGGSPGDPKGHIFCPLPDQLSLTPMNQENTMGKL